MGIGFCPLQIAEKLGRGRDTVESNHIHAVVNAITHIDIKPPWLTKERFVAGAAAAVSVTGGLALAIRLRFRNHAPEQLA